MVGSSLVDGNQSILVMKNVEKDHTMSDSDEDIKKPPIREKEDEHVIPAPSSPPPLKPIQWGKTSEFYENSAGFKHHQVNPLKQELNFAIARLAFEIITSYDQVCILKNRYSPSMEISTLDFMVRQEIKKTFFIEEICRRIHKVLTFLSFETEMDKNLHDLGETLKLLYVLQTSKNYHADKISITLIKFQSRKPQTDGLEFCLTFCCLWHIF